MLRRVKLYLVTGAVVLVALAAAACARDVSAPDAVPAATVGTVGEGAQVRATLHDALEVAVEGGPVRSPRPPADVEGVVYGGTAADQTTGALLALAGGHGRADRDVRFTTDDGHAHRLLFRAAGPDAPIAAVRVERDGELMAEVTYRWTRRAGGFVLESREIALFRRGQVIARHHRSVHGVEVRDAASTLGDPQAGGEGRPPIAMAEALACWREWVSYGTASAALIVAGEVVVVTSGNPASLAALAVAFDRWESALDRLIDCRLNG